MWPTLKPGSKRKLLVMHMGALGDVITSFPALILLRERFGIIDLLCRGNAGKLAVSLGIVDTALPLESARYATLYSDIPRPELVRSFRSFDEILAMVRPEYLPPFWKDLLPGRSHWISSRPPPEKRVRVYRHLMEELERIGLLPENVSEPSLTGNEKTQRNENLILIHPGSGSLLKNWPLYRFVETAHRLEKKGLEPLFILGPAETEIEANLRSISDLGIRMEPDLLLFAGILKSAGFFLGNDSGISHLAGFLGVPSILIFGPSDPARWQPFGPSTQVINIPLSCSFCFETAKEPCSHRRCLVEISTEKVVSQICRTLAIV